MSGLMPDDCYDMPARQTILDTTLAPLRVCISRALVRWRCKDVTGEEAQAQRTYQRIRPVGFGALTGGLLVRLAHAYYYWVHLHAYSSM